MSGALDLELIYVGDPMCSWCWGFAPVVEALDERCDLPLRIVVGGLRTGAAARPMDDRAKRYIAHHWHQVEAVSGQPFDHSFFTREGWVYDTELPAVAVVTMRTLAAEHVLAFFTHLQRSFYADGVDITDPGAYPALLDRFPVDPGRFGELLGSADMKQQAAGDFGEARRLGVLGFPTLLLRDGDDHFAVTRGYASGGVVEQSLSGRLGPSADRLIAPIVDNG